MYSTPNFNASINDGRVTQNQTEITVALILRLPAQAEYCYIFCRGSPWHYLKWSGIDQLRIVDPNKIQDAVENHNWFISLVFLPDSSAVMLLTSKR